jgi:hypothetical protein
MDTDRMREAIVGRAVVDHNDLIVISGHRPSRGRYSFVKGSHVGSGTVEGGHN